jgi:hypothetical protein
MNNKTQLRRQEALEMFRKADINDDVEFSVIFSQGMELLHFSDKDIAKIFGVSRPTVMRWQNGDACPHPMMRKAIFNFFEQQTLMGETDE